MRPPAARDRRFRQARCAVRLLAIRAPTLRAGPFVARRASGPATGARLLQTGCPAIDRRLQSIGSNAVHLSVQVPLNCQFVLPLPSWAAKRTGRPVRAGGLRIAPK